MPISPAGIVTLGRDTTATTDPGPVVPAEWGTQLDGWSEQHGDRQHGDRQHGDRPGAEVDETVDQPLRVPVRVIFSRFWPQTRGLRGWLLVGCGLTALSALAGAVDVWLYKVLVDDVLAPRHFAAFPLLAGVYIGVALAGGAVAFASQYLAARVGEMFVFRLRNRVFDHVQTLSVDFFDRRRLGDTLSRLTSDVEAIEALVLSGAVTTFATLFELVLLTGVLLYLNWRLALLSFVLAPIFAVLSGQFTRRIREFSRRARQRDGAIATVAEETFANSIFIQAYGRQSHQRARFVTQARAAMKASVSAARFTALFTPLVELLQVAGVVLIIGVGVWQLAADRVTLGGLLVFLVYLAQLYGPVNGLSELAATAFSAAAAGERLVELLDQRPAQARSLHPVTLGRSRGRLRLHAVSYRYPDTDRDALSRIDLELTPGQVTAVVGASGSGKTTLVKLLLRLQDPTSGMLTLDGHNLRDLDPDDLRRNIAVVLQETLLMDGTIAENILAGSPGASQDDLLAAARAANAHEFITALPRGYETRVGQRGRLLSGGQRQRIAIARALIRDAPILLLDEPDTGIDTSSSEAILAPLRRLIVGRTTLIISHNPRTTEGADQIVVLEHGRVTATGTHDQLLATHAGYQRLTRAYPRSGQEVAVLAPTDHG
ncbi:MAG TPA: ABC transporter ATP-binding protein [Pseudonocardia sp.]|nr:ABC transporter ATP-binding protein [Pseudonocardia sp.]